MCGGVVSSERVYGDFWPGTLHIDSLHLFALRHLPLSVTVADGVSDVGLHAII